MRGLAGEFMTRSIQIVSLPMIVFLLAACDGPQVKPNDDSNRGEHSSPAPVSGASSVVDQQRFVFSAQTGTFPASSVALDTKTGQLCKTYPWKDIPQLPQGLPVCANASNPTQDSTGATVFIGSQKVYLGHTYTYDGKSWRRGAEALHYDSAGALVGPDSQDQYDPLGLFTKEEKA